MGNIRVANGHAAFVAKVDVFCQTDFKIILFIGNYTNVVFCGQFAFICNTAYYVDLFAQLLADFLADVATILHTVI